MNLTLTRFISDYYRTLGSLIVGDRYFPTIERPWIKSDLHRGGLNSYSCVPPGTYKVIPHNSARFPNTYALVNHDLDVYYQPGDIPAGKTGRTAILVHIGNRVQNVIGCIAVGKYHGMLYGEPSVLNSAVAMRELQSLLGRQSHTLTILEAQ